MVEDSQDKELTFSITSANFVSGFSGLNICPRVTREKPPMCIIYTTKDPSDPSGFPSPLISAV